MDNSLGNLLGTVSKMIDDITIIIPMQSDSKISRQTINSIRKYYPSIKIYLSGQEDRLYYSRRFNHNNKYYYVGNNKGINHLRNYLVTKVNTKYFFMMNDNMIFTEHTILEYLLLFLNNYNVDLVIPHVTNKLSMRPYTLNLDTNNILHKYFYQPIQLDEFPLLYHGGAPCFLAKKESITNNEILWNERDLKDLDQVNFYYTIKNKLRVSYVSNVSLKLNGVSHLLSKPSKFRLITSHNDKEEIPQIFSPIITFTKKFIFGLGTGRCGTQSLAHLLNQQNDSMCVHEGVFYTEFIEKNKIRSIGGLEKFIHLPWKIDKDILIRILLLMEGLKYSYVGDVAFYYLPYIDDIIQLIPSAKFICLKRTRQSVIKSFMEKTSNNYWYQGYKPTSNSTIIYNIWNPCFPKYPISNHHDAIGRYWDEYYETIEQLIKRYPDNIKLFETKDLNNQTEINNLLLWLEYPNPKPLIVHLNSNH